MLDLNVEKHCTTLQSVAARYENMSPEHQSIELAAKALLFIFMNNHSKDFIAQLDEYHQQEERTDEEVLMESLKNAGRRPPNSP